MLAVYSSGFPVAVMVADVVGPPFTRYVSVTEAGSGVAVPAVTRAVTGYGVLVLVVCGSGWWAIRIGPTARAEKL